MSRLARRSMTVACTLVVTAVPTSAALASPPPARTASAYGAQVKRVLDRWAKEYPGVGEETPARLRKQTLSGSAVSRGAAVSLEHVKAPRQWSARQQRTSDALRRFATTLQAMADQLKGKRTVAEAAKVRAHMSRRFFRDAGAVGNAMAALRKAP